MNIEQKIEKLRKSLEKRSKESIINDICNDIDDNNIDDICWVFDIQIED